MADLRYPVGQHDPAAPVTLELVQAAIEDIRELPDRLAAAVEGLDDTQLDTPYRPGGWTVRQLVHHVADSHVNSHIRLRFALTEESPPVRGYAQERWAELHDVKTLPIEPSLLILRGLHERWVALLDSLRPSDFERTMQHSEVGPITIAQLTCLYGWHSRHHVAHVNALREREGW